MDFFLIKTETEFLNITCVMKCTHMQAILTQNTQMHTHVCWCGGNVIDYFEMSSSHPVFD